MGHNTIDVIFYEHGDYLACLAGTMRGLNALAELMDSGAPPDTPCYRIPSGDTERIFALCDVLGLVTLTLG